MLGVVRGGSISETTKGDEDLSFKKDRETGILRSENIVKCGFELRFRFAVLSACNTAKGSVSNGVSIFQNCVVLNLQL